MKLYIPPLALAVLLAGVVAAYATEGRVKPVHSHRTIHHRAHPRHDALAAPALGVTATLYPGVRPWPPFSGERRIDGLSRDPANCASYGCVDNGGF